MTSSPQPWSANNGAVFDENGRQIGFFNDWRDAEVICGELTDAMAELKSDVAQADSEWEAADMECADLEGKFSQLSKILESKDLPEAKLALIAEIVRKVMDDPTTREYVPIDKRT